MRFNSAFKVLTVTYLPWPLYLGRNNKLWHLFQIFTTIHFAAESKSIDIVMGINAACCGSHWSFVAIGCLMLKCCEQ